MSFTSVLFLLLFVPAVVGVYAAIRRRGWRVGVLLGASCLFYATTNPLHLVLLLVAVAWVHAVCRGDGIVGGRWRLALAIGVPVASLVVHKYLDFLAADVLGLPVAALGPFASLMLPVGISFYTFEMISYAIDRYRGEVGRSATFAELALFITFFPHLAAGPILRFRQFADQLSDLWQHRLLADGLVQAMTYMVTGLALKLGIADTLAQQLEPLVARPSALTSMEAAYLLFAFSFRIYFDFFGYSLMAIGMGRLFGITLPDNFNRPYESLSPREFWQRWHMSLSFWIRDYLYLPLGGNRDYKRNIMIVFALCGLWHGAGWNFLAWGLYHGVLVAGYHACRNQWDFLPALARRALTFVLVSLGWLAFLFDFDGVVGSLGSLAGLGASGPSFLDGRAWLILGAAAAACWAFDVNRLVAAIEARPHRHALTGGSLAVVAAGCLFLASQSTAFIYFRF
jgi:alginate O-acetyltransferase complex protein AlgI